MSVTEMLQQAGEWSIGLRPDTPAELRRRLRIDPSDPASVGHGWLVITPQWVDPAAYPAPASPSTAVHPLCAAAQWAGVLEVVDGRHDLLTGRGLLGAVARGSVGEYATQLADSTITGTGPQLAEFLLDGTSRTITGGLNAGSSTSLGASSALRTGNLGSWVQTVEIGGVLGTRADLLRYACESTNNAFRVRPTGEVDVDTVATLWGGSPQILFTAQRVVTDQVAVVPLGRNDRGDSLVDWANGVVGDAAGSTGPYFTLSTGSGEVWSPGRRSAVRWDLQSDPTQDEDVFEWRDRADLLAEARSIGTTTYEVHASPSRSLVVEPGELVWLHDPEVGLEDPTNTLTAGVDVIHPVEVRLHAVTWPVRQGMGVYLLYVDRTFGTLVRTIDLTPWVAWEDDDGWSWEIGGLAPWRDA